MILIIHEEMKYLTLKILQFSLFINYKLNSVKNLRRSFNNDSLLILK